MSKHKGQGGPGSVTENPRGRKEVPEHYNISVKARAAQEFAFYAGKADAGRKGSVTESPETSPDSKF